MPSNKTVTVWLEHVFNGIQKMGFPTKAASFSTLVELTDRHLHSLERQRNATLLLNTGDLGESKPLCSTESILTLAWLQLLASVREYPDLPACRIDAALTCDPIDKTLPEYRVRKVIRSLQKNSVFAIREPRSRYRQLTFPEDTPLSAAFLEDSSLHEKHYMFTLPRELRLPGLLDLLQYASSDPPYNLTCCGSDANTQSLKAEYDEHFRHFYACPSITSDTVRIDMQVTVPGVSAPSSMTLYPQARLLLLSASDLHEDKAISYVSDLIIKGTKPKLEALGITACGRDIALAEQILRQHAGLSASEVHSALLKLPTVFQLRDASIAAMRLLACGCQLSGTSFDARADHPSMQQSAPMTEAAYTQPPTKASSNSPVPPATSSGNRKRPPSARIDAIVRTLIGNKLIQRSDSFTQLKQSVRRACRTLQAQRGARVMLVSTDMTPMFEVTDEKSISFLSWFLVLSSSIWYPDLPEFRIRELMTASPAEWSGDPEASHALSALTLLNRTVGLSMRPLPSASEPSPAHRYMPLPIDPLPKALEYAEIETTEVSAYRFRSHDAFTWHRILNTAGEFIRRTSATGSAGLYYSDDGINEIVGEERELLDPLFLKTPHHSLHVTANRFELKLYCHSSLFTLTVPDRADAVLVCLAAQLCDEKSIIVRAQEISGPQGLKAYGLLERYAGFDETASASLLDSLPYELKLHVPSGFISGMLDAGYSLTVDGSELSPLAREQPSDADYSDPDETPSDPGGSESPDDPLCETGDSIHVTQEPSIIDTAQPEQHPPRSSASKAISGVTPDASALHSSDALPEIASVSESVASAPDPQTRLVPESVTSPNSISSQEEPASPSTLPEESIGSVPADSIDDSGSAPVSASVNTTEDSSTSAPTPRKLPSSLFMIGLRCGNSLVPYVTADGLPFAFTDIKEAQACLLSLRTEQLPDGSLVECRNHHVVQSCLASLFHSGMDTLEVNGSERLDISELLGAEARSGQNIPDICLRGLRSLLIRHYCLEKLRSPRAYGNSEEYHRAHISLRSRIYRILYGVPLFALTIRLPEQNTWYTEDAMNLVSSIPVGSEGNGFDSEALLLPGTLSALSIRQTLSLCCLNRAGSNGTVGCICVFTDYIRAYHAVEQYRQNGYSTSIVIVSGRELITRYAASTDGFVIDAMDTAFIVPRSEYGAVRAMAPYTAPPQAHPQ